MTLAEEYRSLCTAAVKDLQKSFDNPEATVAKIQTAVILLQTGVHIEIAAQLMELNANLKARQ